MGKGSTSSISNRVRSHRCSRIRSTGSSRARRAGSAALDLCYVAAGRADGFWEEILKRFPTIEIVEEPKADRLRFIATTDRARAEETLATGQLRLADAFIAQASAKATARLVQDFMFFLIVTYDFLL